MENKGIEVLLSYNTNISNKGGDGPGDNTEWNDYETFVTNRVDNGITDQMWRSYTAPYPALTKRLEGQIYSSTCARKSYPVARASSFKGPYEKYTGNPVLSGNDLWHCTGHGTFVNTPGGKTYYLHHAYNKSSNVYTGRQGLLAELNWRTDDWPSLTELPAASMSVDNINDSFLAAKPAKYWQWDFRHAAPVITQGDGRLMLSGSTSVNNNAGLALTVRPVTDHFEVTTTVVNINGALKGLVFYGDADAAVGVGVENNIIKFWKTKKDTFSVMASQAVKPGAVELKLLTLPGGTCTSYYRTGTKEWTALGNEAQAVNISFLPQWDRSPRVGLHVKGKTGSAAVFSLFALKYL